MLVCAGLLALGGGISWLTITHGPSVVPEEPPVAPHPVDGPHGGR
jgi:hypothetical protein